MTVTVWRRGKRWKRGAGAVVVIAKADMLANVSGKLDLKDGGGDSKGLSGWENESNGQRGQLERLN